MQPKNLGPMHVTVVDSRPEWPEYFEAEAVRLRPVLGRNLVALFHIGSTSVPGLKAKPIIDILPVVHDIALLDTQTDAFRELGYKAKGEFGIPGRRYFQKGGANRTHQIHAFQYDNTHAILRHVAFRDYLRTHPAVCDAYATLKARLAEQHPEDIGAYCDGKDDFVKREEANALIWFWEEYAGLDRR